MSFKFVSLYGVVVILTSLFFQFVPLPDMLSWEEMLLSKLLNQAPVLLCIGYLWFQRKRVRKTDIFFLLMAFLCFNVFSEIYYYVASPDYLVLLNILNNIFIYIVLMMLYIRQRVQIREHVIKPKNIRFAVLAGLCFLTGFSFALINVYQVYFTSEKLLFFIILSATIITTVVVCLSFFVDKAFSKNWYKVVIGTIAIAILDVYVYLSLFVFEAYPFFIYTIGKIVFSAGILLIVDRVARKCLNKEILAIYYAKSSKSV